MGRTCRCCTSKQRSEIDKDILANHESASTIAARYSVTKGSVLSHRRNHLSEAVASTLSQGAIELKEMLARADKLIRLLTIHMKEKPRSAVSLDWIRESRDVRGWFTYHSKHIGKAIPAKETQKREGDKFVISFVASDGKRAEVPLSVYQALPSEVFKTDGALGRQSNAPQEVGKDSVL